MVRCAVLDSGAGIPPEREITAFEPYSRLVEDPTFSSPGLGLGLPIVRDLVIAHGGDVRILRGGMNGLEFTLLSATAGTDQLLRTSQLSPQS